VNDAERRPLLAANWKMNPVTRAEALALARGFEPAAREHVELVQVTVFPPFCWLAPVADMLDGSGIGVGAQDCFHERSGAFTGEVSAAMLAGWCSWVIVGHFERRSLFGEADDQVAAKVAAAFRAGLRLIVCVGEQEADRRSGRTDQVVCRQLATAVRAVPAVDVARLVIAYEPVWAIGTGRSAAAADVASTVDVIRRCLRNEVGPTAGLVPVLYGGSVNAANIASYVRIEGCSGCLVGGASLSVTEFSSMIGAVAQVTERGAG
jgi:triosephosphate isomerase